MPTLFKMSDEKQIVESPSVVIAETVSSAKARNTKKYVIIAVSIILSAVIILTAILVGMYMFSEAQKEILKYSLELHEKVKQDVVSDPNTNIVQYHTNFGSDEAWIVNDFNRDIQVVKIKSERGTNCYVSALNRSASMDPSKAVKPETVDVKTAESLTYSISGTPIADTSFLAKAASDMCKGVSTYWAYPQCADKNPSRPPNATDDLPAERTKRAAPYYTLSYQYYAGYNVPCYQGCCRTICACSISITVYYYNGVFYCVWYSYSCPPYIYANPVYNYCSNGPTGLRCPNYSPARVPTC